MSREQIRVRVDTQQWESLRKAGESNTELLDRILSNWYQQRDVLSALTELDANPSQALGRLLASHELLSTAIVTINPPTESSTPQLSAAQQSAETAAELIGGLENNGDDW